MKFRIGHGYDVHRISPERKMVLGGVEIPCGYGLEAHSDGDVLIHALIDALFGSRYKKGAEISGGVILILMGIKILLEHLGVISF